MMVVLMFDVVLLEEELVGCWVYGVWGSEELIIC